MVNFGDLLNFNLLVNLRWTDSTLVISCLSNGFQTIELNSKTEKAENEQIAHFWRRKQKRVSVGF